MSVPEISPQVTEFLRQRLLGRLATASPDGQPHIVPVWFLWEDGAVWISSYRSTRKVIDIEHNRKCALVVDIENADDGLTAVVLEGQAELVSVPADTVKQRIERIYTKYLGPDGVLEQDPQNWLNSPENVLIKFTPTRVKSW
jgi:PPOX class probable F420-dependent enzyme